MNSKLDTIRKAHPYFQAVVLILAMIGIVNCFVSLPNIYQAAVVLFENFDLFAAFKGTSDLEHFVN